MMFLAVKAAMWVEFRFTIVTLVLVGLLALSSCSTSKAENVPSPSPEMARPNLDQSIDIKNGHAILMSAVNQQVGITVQIPASLLDKSSPSDGPTLIDIYVNDRIRNTKIDLTGMLNGGERAAIFNLSPIIDGDTIQFNFHYSKAMASFRGSVSKQTETWAISEQDPI